MTNPNDPAFAFEGCTMAVNKELMAIPEFKDKAFAIAQHYQGLTKREYFAAMALQGILSGLYSDSFLAADFFTCSKDAIGYADALIAELSKEPSK